MQQSKQLEVNIHQYKYYKLQIHIYTNICIYTNLQAKMYEVLFD